MATIGTINIISGRTKPVTLEYRKNERIVVELCYAGTSELLDGISSIQTYSGEVLGFQSGGGILNSGYHSGISFCLDKKRLERTAAAIYGNDVRLHTDIPAVIRRESMTEGVTGSRLLFSLFRLIDSILVATPLLTDKMVLDEQIYRAYVFSIAKEILCDEAGAQQHKKMSKDDAMEGIVAYIQSRISSPISVTDLEEYSHYSARHLQNLFRKRFECTPMQFVRRQRLSSAMEKLQTADWDDTVTSIGRDCGYRFTSNFSSDFHREFGVAPSVVLRTARTPGIRSENRQIQGPWST